MKVRLFENYHNSMNIRREYHREVSTLKEEKQ